MNRAIGKLVVLLFAAVFSAYSLSGQTNGRVVINEYMPWTSNGCGTTAEFIELLNFGPGAVDISCYIVTTGQFSITIPPRTVLQPGEFYVIAGQDFLPGDCANVDSARTGVYADLNWNTCNCTNTAIPTSGDGLMVDGGTSNTPLVLFDPALNIVDAVVRSLPTEPTTYLTTADANGCTPHGFDISTLPVVYEELGMSAGRGNSFARITDGDCGWVKDPKQSAAASNNRDGDVTDIEYNFSLLNAMSCDSTGGRISIYVEHADYASIFPMNYTVANDINNDGRFDERDEYATFVDDTPPSIDVVGLPVGHYRVTISSVKGCYLKTFEFTIFTCTEVLPVSLEYFRVEHKAPALFALAWKLQHVENLKNIVVEKSRDGREFFTAEVIRAAEGEQGSKTFGTAIKEGTDYFFYRLRVVQRTGGVYYSPTVRLPVFRSPATLWPNPAGGTLNLFLKSKQAKKQPYAIYDEIGREMLRGGIRLREGENTSTLNVGSLLPGVYLLKLFPDEGREAPLLLRFVKR